MVIRRVSSASPTANEGKTWVTGVSQPNFPSSASTASKSDVSGLVVDAIRNSVFGVTGAFFPSSLTPKPRSKTTLPPWRMATAIPGMLAAFRPSSMKASSSRRRVSSSTCAVLP